MFNGRICDFSTFNKPALCLPVAHACALSTVEQHDENLLYTQLGGLALVRPIMVFINPHPQFRPLLVSICSKRNTSAHYFYHSSFCLTPMCTRTFLFHLQKVQHCVPLGLLLLSFLMSETHVPSVILPLSLCTTETVRAMLPLMSET